MWRRIRREEVDDRLLDVLLYCALQIDELGKRLVDDGNLDLQRGDPFDRIGQVDESLKAVEDRILQHLRDRNLQGVIRDNRAEWSGVRRQLELAHTVVRVRRCRVA